MTTYLKGLDIPSVPTDESDIYPETDGKPMAVSDLHRRILIRTLQVLDTHFEERPEVYVSGDILMYYVEGDPRKSVAPDVLVTFGLGKKLRRTYKVWEEGKVPDFAMEFSSENTYRNDLGKKLELYGLLGIQDYFLYDAEGLYLPSALMGFELVDDVYVPISAGPTGGLHSSALGLDFHVDNVGLGIYDPAANDWLQTPAESALSLAEQEAIRAETAEARAETAEARAEQETTRAETAEARAEQAEADAAKLREQLARLQTRT
ncbi:MAG: Uma2 family endonuclease [Candidatus Poribacteria bacterium]|nr:Uma2 family endonuclease [Candidatus Poribacteria bacterium]